jgi:hypothetical protein
MKVAVQPDRSNILEAIDLLVTLTIPSCSQARGFRKAPYAAFPPYLNDL